MSDNFEPPVPGDGCYDVRKERPPCTAGKWRNQPTAWCVPCKDANPAIVAAAFTEPNRQQEEESVASVRRLLQHVEEQVEKRQYLNAADAAAEMVRRLMSAYSAVTKQD